MRIVLGLVLVLSANNNLARADDALEAGFRNPPTTARARTWWHWINGNVSREGITADLEAMKAVGIQEAQIFNVSLGDPRGTATYLSPQWLEMFHHAALEAKRLNLELGFHNGPGWSSSGGPWVTPEYAMQTVVHSKTVHKGGKRFKARLLQPKARLNYYRDIVVLAFPKPVSNQRIDGLDFKVLSDRIRNHLSPDPKVIPATALVKTCDIINLTGKVAADGFLEWDAPAGDWIILRLGHTPTGQRNRPAPFGGQGLECDKMSRAAVDVFWKGGIDPIIDKLGSLAGSVLTNCVIDSYEVGTTNWTPGFEKEFFRLRGYDCTNFLPALAGYYVDSGEISERFLWDFRRTIGDLMSENYYSHFRKLCHEHGMKLSVEPYWGPFDNMQVGENGDIVMCEFWSGDIAFFDSPKFVASIAKLNRDSIVGAEAFTGLGGWTEHPATIKSIGDRAWAQGINRFIFHSYVHQPWDVGPGLTLSYHGLELNRLNTWWKQGIAFLDYVGRGQFLLQQGQSVADVLVFTGEASPNDAPLITAIKAMGYDYDLIGSNKFQSLSFDDGSIRTPTGGKYRALVLPKTEWMKPGTIRKLEELATAGATILGPQPEKSPSLQGYLECDDHVSRLANKLWGDGLIKDDSIVDFLNDGTVPPDFSVDNDAGQELVFIHRKTDLADIYFVASHRKEIRHERCRFRVSGMQPEIWNAETGEISNAPEWQSNDDGTTSVPLQFAAEASLFVVFRKPISTSDHIVKTMMELERPQLMPLPHLKIVKAEYGTFLPDGLVDVTQILAAKIKDNHLKANVNRGLFESDPAPGYNKELRIKYMTGDTIRQAVVMEREDVDLDAAGEGELKIVKAVFGKFADSTQGVPASSRAVDVTAKIEAVIASGVVEIPVDDRLAAGQSDESKGKKLHITFSTRGQLHKRSIRAGRTLLLGPDAPEAKLVPHNDEIHWVTPYRGQLTYRFASGDTKTARVRLVPDPIELSGPWDVRFPANRGAPENATLDELKSWSTSEKTGIRFFSGTATYKKQFVVPGPLLNPDTSLELDLGNVCVIAEVILNGRCLGTLWKTPFRVNVDGAIRAGTNELEIKVTNLWANRLIGDDHLPVDVKRKGAAVQQWPEWLLKNQTPRTSGRVGFAAYKHWNKNSTLQPSGLLGPVVVQPFIRVPLEK